MTNKEDFKEVFNPDFCSVITCEYCKEDIILEDDKVYMDFSWIRNYYEDKTSCFLEFGLDKEEIEEILNEGDCDEIKKYLDNDYWENTCICEKCYDRIGVSNPAKYEKLLDLIFEGYPMQENMYRRSMSLYFPNIGSGSTVALNNIINGIYSYDWYYVTLNGLGSFDKCNKDFAVDILKRFAGVDVELMQETNRNKNIALGRHVY